jgi:uncharacterized protein (DUF2336 family)
MADTGNQFRLAQAGYDQAGGQFNATMGAQADAANQTALNQYGLTQAGMNADAARSNAANQQQMSLANMSALDSAGQWNGGATNQQNQFNAGLQDAQSGRALQSAGMLGDIANQYGAGVRGDLGLMGQLGDQQRAIEAQYAMAPLAQLQSLGQLYGTTPYNLFNGSNVSSNGTSQGTNVTTSTPSLFSQMLAAAQVASGFVPK